MKKTAVNHNTVDKGLNMSKLKHPSVGDEVRREWYQLSDTKYLPCRGAVMSIKLVNAKSPQFGVVCKFGEWVTSSVVTSSFTTVQNYEVRYQ
ncbi:hypothetical protein TNCV_1113561 [Trichonephila clavipes]|nr:hypothetical protein TNCV_1113561 [Trichonephila clavipes]